MTDGNANEYNTFTAELELRRQNRVAATKREPKPTKRVLPSPEKVPVKKPRTYKPKEAKSKETKKSNEAMGGLQAYRLAGIDALIDKAGSRAIELGNFDAIKDLINMRRQSN